MLQMGGDDLPEDSKSTSKGRAMPFSLIKLAYFACDPESRELYDTKTHGVSVDLQNCCNHLMQPSCMRRPFKPKTGEESDLCYIAASYGHIDCLQQAHVAGFPWNWRTIEVSCQCGHMECLKYVHENGCELAGSVPVLAAASASNINILEYAWNHGFEFPSNLCTMIARSGAIESLRYIRSLGFVWDVNTTAEAALYNQLEILKYLRQNSCPWDASTCHSAAKNGHIECLKYAHTNGCPWDERTCRAAAEYGHIECLKYAHINGCEWDAITPIVALINLHHDCFNYALSRGCPRAEIHLIERN